MISNPFSTPLLPLCSPRQTIALPLSVGCCFARSAMHYAQTTSCELSLWFGVSGLRFVAPPLLSPFQSRSTRSEPDCDSEPRTLRSRPPRLVALRPERPSRSPSGSSPTPRISILACLLIIEIRVISAPYLHGADRPLSLSPNPLENLEDSDLAISENIYGNHHVGGKSA
jgi:hypothetical protein